MDQLPDDVVLLVFRFVGVDDLFAFRRVCKRLGSLALHPGVWRHRRFNGQFLDSDGRNKLCRLLRLAPRLGWLALSPMSTPGHQLALYATTRCAVRRLTLEVQDVGSVAAALIVRNQEALGQLKVVEVKFLNTTTWADAVVLLGTLASMSVLNKLVVRFIDNIGGHSPGSLLTPVPRPSLKYFKCGLKSKAQHFIDLVLAGHAATLEEVHLADNFEFITTSTGSLPICMPKLRELTCSLLPGMETLGPSLTKVALHVTPDMRPGLLGATEMLRRAPKLRVVTLKYSPAARSSTDVGVALVEALAWSGQSAVEVLDIDNDWDNEREGEENDDGVEFLPQLQPLVRALPSLPALRHLELSVYVPPDELLLAITPATVPALRDLKLHPMRWLPARCAHDWRHKDSVQTLLSVNPALKFSVYTTAYCLKGQRQFCGACAEGCHNTLWEWDWELEFDENDPFIRLESQDWIHIQ